jgi:hypothetical protein
VNLNKLAQRTDEAGILLRLMMACNDLSIANSRFGEVRGDPATAVGDNIRWGIGMYFLRLQIGHLNEALSIIDDLQRHPVLSPMVGACSSHGQESFAKLTDCLEGGSQRKTFVSTIMIVRSTSVFHYDDKLIRKALKYRATRPVRTIVPSVTSSNDIRAVHFGVADVILDTLTSRFIWKAKEENFHEQIESRLAFGYDLLRALLEFSPTFALRRLLADRPNYIWFACNNNHPKKA